MAAARSAAVPAPEGLPLFSKDFYAPSGGLPEGKYWWEDVSLVMHSGFGKNTSNSPAKLGIMITMRPLDDPGHEPRKQFYSLGQKAHESFAPDPTGKILLPIPGAKAQRSNELTNAGVLIDSMIQSCSDITTLPQNDCKVFDGMWVYMHNVPAPEGRSKITQNTTGESADPSTQPRSDLPIAVVSEVLEGGKPWEGGGGNPAGKGVTVTPKATPAAATKSTPAPEPAPAEATDDIRSAAIAGLAEALGANPEGGGKLLIKTKAATYIKTKYGADLMNQFVKTYFGAGCDPALNDVLGELMYKTSGNNIVPAE